jgi:hypothetical protein
MRLETNTGQVFNAHFRHVRHEPRLNESNGKLYEQHTECVFHEGQCNRERHSADEPIPLCPIPIERRITAVAKCSVLDHFDKHRGHFLAFQRALNQHTADRNLRRALFEAYWARVRKPRHRG